MKILTCPLNGPRNMSEFTYGGEYHPTPDFHHNTAGVVTEWWCHNASSYWFLAERNTLTDEVLRTFDCDQLYNQRIDFSAVTTPETRK